jgi:hypothetical protein
MGPWFITENHTARTSENSVTAKFAEFQFYAVG